MAIARASSAGRTCLRSVGWLACSPCQQSCFLCVAWNFGGGSGCGDEQDRSPHCRACSLDSWCMLSSIPCLARKIKNPRRKRAGHLSQAGGASVARTQFPCNFDSRAKWRGIRPSIGIKNHDFQSFSQRTCPTHSSALVSRKTRSNNVIVSFNVMLF